MTPGPDTLKQGCAELAASDSALANAYEAIGVPVWRSGTSEFATLARMIAFQQISTRAGATIWGRVEELCPEMTAATILAADDEALRGCGLSRPKVRYLKAIATDETSGALDFSRLQSAPIADARRELTAVKGIGPWTAEVFLLYTAGHLDAFPPGDVGLMEAYRLLADQDQRMEAKAFSAHAENWAPWRGVATHLLWGWINAARERDNAPPT